MQKMSPFCGKIYFLPERCHLPRKRCPLPRKRCHLSAERFIFWRKDVTFPKKGFHFRPKGVTFLLKDLPSAEKMPPSLEKVSTSAQKVHFRRKILTSLRKLPFHQIKEPSALNVRTPAYAAIVVAAPQKRQGNRPISPRLACRVQQQTLVA